MKGEFEKRLRGKASRPMQQAGVYDPMEQADYRNMVLVKTVLDIVEEARKDWLENVAFGDKPNEFVDDELAKEWFETWFRKE